jgi:hypothetical protein
MPNTKAVGVAFADPEFESVTVTGAVTAASVTTTGALSGTQLDLNAPVIKTASFTLGDTENFVVCNGTALAAWFGSRRLRLRQSTLLQPT